MAKLINWGIIGLGGIAHKFAADMRLAENTQLKGVASRSATKAQEFARQYQADTYYSDYVSLAEDDTIDIVYIATPNTLHYENTLLCLQNNKSVVCEKPLGVASGEVENMLAAARSRNLFLMEAIWTQFIPAFRKAMQLLADGAIGEAISVHANFGFKRAFDAESRLFNRQLGGGSLLDIGIYPIVVSYAALGFPADIKAVARKTTTQVDRSCEMIFQYENGSTASLSSTFEAHTTNEAFIYGTEGKIKLEAPFHHPQQIVIDNDKGREALAIPHRGNGYVHEIESVNECLQQGLLEHPEMPLAGSLAISQIIDKVKKEIGVTYESG